LLWDSPRRNASFEEAAEAVWGDRHDLLIKDQVGSIRKKLNHFFTGNSIPLRVRTGKDFIALEEIPERAEKPAPCPALARAAL
jgi:hypothetical protein